MTKWSIGICGHKDIVTPEKEIRKALMLFWAVLQREYQECVFHMLDSLAEGGDQYALASKPDVVAYTAVLPFSSNEYETDFESQEAKQKYYALLNSATNTVVAGSEKGNYVPAAEYILAHSNMILTLWDCIMTAGAPAPGGSYDTIVKAVERRLPVIVIPVRRKKNYTNIKQDIFPEECIPYKLNQDFCLKKWSCGE